MAVKTIVKIVTMDFFFFNKSLSYPSSSNLFSQVKTPDLFSFCFSRSQATAPIHYPHVQAVSKVNPTERNSSMCGGIIHFLF